ncbi:MAG: S41 family peptidase [Oscillospiraceae bacterium]
MNKKISASAALAITLIAMTVTFSITMILAMRIFDAAVPAVMQKQVLNNKLYEIDKYVRGNYFGDIDDTALGDGAANGYFAGLGDQNAVYYTAAQYTEIQGLESEKILSIGLVVNRDANGYLRVVKVHASSPAAEVGIEADNIIETINDIDARTLTIGEVYTLLRGEEGTTVVLQVRQGSSTVNTYSIQRRNSFVAPTMYYEMQGNVAYVRIESLGARSYAEFSNIVREATDAGAQGFIFDVRGFASQDLQLPQSLQYEQVYSMIDLACPVGTIATAEYKNNTIRVLRSSDQENQITLPMVVVVNGATSGPLELFACSLRHLSGAQLIGTQTAGNGMLQSTPQRMSDGSAVAITIARIYTSDSTSFDGTGLTPDSEWTVSEGEVNLQNISFASDKQVQRALQILQNMGSRLGITIDAPSTGTLPESQPDTSTEGTDDSSAVEGTDSSVASGTDDSSASVSA